MAYGDLHELTNLLEDWCRSLESGDPGKITSLYDTKATVAYECSCLQGRDELDDLLRGQRRKLAHLRVASTEVEHVSSQRLRFKATVIGPFGQAIFANDWTVQDGRIRDHALALLELEGAPAFLAA